MLTVRFITTSAILLTTLGAAAAQSTTAIAPAQILSQPAQPTATPQARVRTVRLIRTRHVTHAAAHAPAPAAGDTAPSGAWPAGNSAPLLGIDANAAGGSVFPAVDHDMGEPAVGVRTVQFAAPDGAGIDFTAADRAAPDREAQSTATPAVALLQQRDDATDGDRRYEAWLAPLGGALAAGAVAWFLIGAARLRTYAVP
jgi:hypothetical protein